MRQDLVINLIVSSNSMSMSGIYSSVYWSINVRMVSFSVWMQLDLPFSPIFYHWLLGQESFLTGSDLVYIDPDLARTYKSLNQVVIEKHRIEQDLSLNAAQRQQALQTLTLDGCLIVDLGLDFTLPGSPAIELRKGGKDIPVTIHNLEQYLKVFTSTRLVLRSTNVRN